MNHSKIKTESDAIIYLTECTLATVESIAMRKNYPVGERKSHISLAQKAINIVKWFGIISSPTISPRIEEVIVKYDLNVELWYNYLKNDLFDIDE
jgi:hypothetical protein